MKKILYILAAAVITASCNSVDIKPSDRYDVSYAFASQKNAELYLNSFYPIVRDFGQFGSCALGGSNSSMSDGLTDMLKYGAIVAGAGDCNLIMTVDGRQSESSNYFDAWTVCYTWIRRINEFLDGLETYGGNFSAEVSAQLRAEALFFRSYAYFMIMRSHASTVDDLGVILRKDLASSSGENVAAARANISDSWDFIYADALYAAQNLKEPEASGGRVHRNAALALIAREMLYAGRYDKAKEAALELRESGLYAYTGDYASIFRSLSASDEVIWGLEYSSGDLTHSFDAKYSLPGDICESGSYGGGYAGPTQEFVDSYDCADGTAFAPAGNSARFITPENVGERDPRLAASVLFNRAQFKGREVECFEGGYDQKYMPYGSVNTPGNTVTGYYMRKFMDEDNRDYVLNGSCQPWCEFRYAEAMLILAECLARENDFDGCASLLRELRAARFGREDVACMKIDSFESALDALLHERSIELAFEGHRFWDLRRTGRAREVLDGKRYSGVLWHRQSDGTFTPEEVACDMSAHIYPERFDRFPIPQTERRNNSLAVQNNDW